MHEMFNSAFDWLIKYDFKLFGVFTYRYDVTSYFHSNTTKQFLVNLARASFGRYSPAEAKIGVVPVTERNAAGRLHLHALFLSPNTKRASDAYFPSLVRKHWMKLKGTGCQFRGKNKTCELTPIRDKNAALAYVLKNYRFDYDCIDWENCWLPQ